VKRGISLSKEDRVIPVNFKSVLRFFAVALVLLTMCLSGCRRQVPEPGASSNITLAAPLEAPSLPVLVAKSDGSCVSAQRVAYVWPSGADLFQEGEDTGELILEELWALSAPEDNLVTCVDEQVVFSLFLPQTHTKDLEASGTLDVWTYFEARYAFSEPVPIYTEDLKLRSSSESSDEGADVSFQWDIPTALLKEPDNSFIVRVGLAFGDGGESSENDLENLPTVSFAFTLMLAQEGSTDRILDLSQTLNDAAWSGDESVLSEIFPEWDMGLSDSVMPYNVHAPGTGKSLLWSFPGKTFTLKEEPAPEFQITSFGPSIKGPYAETATYYEVEVKDEASGTKEVWAVEETINLKKDDSGDDSWKVFMVTRSSFLLESTNPDALPGLGIFPEIVKSEKDILHVLRVGPFYQVRPWDGCKWSRDGKYVALPCKSKREEPSLDTSGSQLLGSSSLKDVSSYQGARRISDSFLSSVWAVNPYDGTGVRLFATDSSLSIQVLDWAPNGSKVRFMVMGTMTAGPHIDKSGYWIVEADLDSLEIRDIGFVRYPYVPPYPGDLFVGGDGQTVVFSHLHDLWKVDMEKAETTRIADDLPTWDGLFSLKYSPSGLFAGYGLVFDVGRTGYVSYDLTSGEKREVEIDPSRISVAPGLRGGSLAESDWTYFYGFSPDDEMLIELCRFDELNHGEDSSVPAGATALCLYTPQGDLKQVIPVPTGDPNDRIGISDWSSDRNTLAMVVGPLGEVFCEEIGFDVRHVVPKGVWIWDKAQGTTTKLCDIPVQFDLDRPKYAGTESIKWVEDDANEPQALEVWFLWDPETGTPEQTGIRVHLDGNVEPIKRICPYSEEGQGILGNMVDITFVTRREEGSTVNAFDVLAKIGAAQGDGKEILITENGPLRVENVIIENDKMVMTAQTPDEYGNGSYWIYVIYP
jgi:hypothetical protein